jgi:hypothetical protein
LPLTLEHAGQNVVQFIVPDAEGELTDRNNAAVVQINGDARPPAGAAWSRASRIPDSGHGATC